MVDYSPTASIASCRVEDLAFHFDSDKKFHAVLCDPPYGLGKIKDINALIASWLAEEEHEAGKGFMNKDWDVIPPPSTWQYIRENMVYPGAVLLAFGGTRTSDLLSLALRLGGWEKFDEILHWSYGSGYPKVYDIGKAIDRAAGATREVIGTKLGLPGYSLSENKDDRSVYGAFTDAEAEVSITAPATEDAKAWDGYATLLKPAQEPILCFRAPYDGTYVDRALAFGTSALNIHGARVDQGGYDERTFGRGWKQDKSGLEVYAGNWSRDGRHTSQGAEKGRWPANLVLTHLPECHPSGIKRVKATKKRVQKKDKEYKSGSRAGAWNAPEGLTTSGYADEDGREAVIEWACVDGCPVKQLTDQAGIRKSGKAPETGFVRNSDKHRNTYSPTFKGQTVEPTVLYGDEGSVARYFFQTHWAHEIYERIASAPSTQYQSKASNKERNVGVSGEAIVTDDGRSKPNDTPYQRGKTKRLNYHPTLKPIELIKWLSTLILPPAEIGERRLLVPFAGSGSETIGAMLAGWDSILGVEADEDYCRIARERIDFWWEYYRNGAFEVRKILDSWMQEQQKNGPDQMRMFE